MSCEKCLDERVFNCFILVPFRFILSREALQDGGSGSHHHIQPAEAESAHGVYSKKQGNVMNSYRLNVLVDNSLPDLACTRSIGH